jgi:hypothetical protein
VFARLAVPAVIESIDRVITARADSGRQFFAERELVLYDGRI